MSKSLTKAQFEYATRRLAELCLRKATEAAGPKPAVKPLTLQEKAAMVRKGQAVLKKGAEQNEYFHWPQAFEFPQTSEQKKLEAWDKKYKAAHAKYNAEARKVEDKLMFLGAEEALAALEEFAKK